MLSEDQIRNQIQQFLADKKLANQDKAAFLLATVDVVRKKFALEVEESLKEQDISDIEKIKDDQKAMEEMVNRWQKNTGKTPAARLQEIILEFFDKFLEAK